MKLSDLKPCASCGGTLPPMWYTVRISPTMLDPKAATIRLHVHELSTTVHDRPRQILDITDAGILAERIGRMAERIDKLESRVSPELVDALVKAMGVVVGKHIPNPDDLIKIRDECGALETDDLLRSSQYKN